MSARLGDDAFLDRCERARLAYETVRLSAAIQGAAAKGDETLGERVALLELPRQQSLIEFLTGHPQTASIAGALRALTASKRAGSLRAAMEKHAPEFENTLGRVRGIYSWRDALRARAP